jgi:hypothetical protein
MPRSLRPLVHPPLDGYIVRQTMGRTDGHEVCKSCDATLGYCLIHNGSNESAFAYCDRCGITALFDGWSKAIPVGADLKVHGPIGADVEAYVSPCNCGGRFTGVAFPRCTRCHVPRMPTCGPLHSSVTFRAQRKGGAGRERGLGSTR